jgi:hypothetical protein
MGNQLHQKQIDRMRSRVSEELVRCLLVSYIENGIINVFGKSDQEIFSVLHKIINSKVKKKEFNFGLDHMPDLLELARSFKKKRRPELSCLFYSTWIEHWINKVIMISCSRKKLSGAAYKALVRECSLRGKLSLISELFKHKPIRKEQVKAILAISEARNAFVHYKWPYDSDFGVNKDLQEAVKNAEKIVKYLKGYHENTFLSIKEDRISSILHLEMQKA